MSALLRLCAALTVALVFTAGATPASAAQCKAASDCRGPLPQYCRQCGGHHSVCAHWACVSGSCEIQTCPAGEPQCRKASDCRGPLPDICKRCANGRQVCAHHACVAGQCETQICPRPS